MLRKVLDLEGTKRLEREQLQIIHGGGCPMAGCGSTDPKPDEPEDSFEE
ncbi:hypothetical protein [Aquimarina spongiae]|uniref:Uncharacterized protein n=1 Tax=Aquimarina spongiae TaxID=570521 RepID=A0A1M6J1E7_9FLAO|nr:hypothetical protein [Aquimarina spongiae]SHJ40441.1 hypothetical protein SAMN04488508_108186 [Aquimarina spongiae]